MTVCTPRAGRGASFHLHPPLSPSTAPQLPPSPPLPAITHPASPRACSPSAHSHGRRRSAAAACRWTSHRRTVTNSSLPPWGATPAAPAAPPAPCQRPCYVTASPRRGPSPPAAVAVNNGATPQSTPRLPPGAGENPERPPVLSNREGRGVSCRGMPPWRPRKEKRGGNRRHLDGASRRCRRFPCCSHCLCLLIPPSGRATLPRPPPPRPPPTAVPAASATAIGGDAVAAAASRCRRRRPTPPPPHLPPPSP